MTLRELFGFRAANRPTWASLGELPNELVLVQARKLHAAFEANEVAAEREYKDADLLVNGVVARIARERGRIVVELESGESVWPVCCYFEEDQAETVATLERGEVVLVVGTCSGRWLRSVLLRGCRLTEGTIEAAARQQVAG